MRDFAGHGKVDRVNTTTKEYFNGTLEYLTTDPRTMAQFAKLKNPLSGEWVKRDDVWIYYNDTGSGNPGTIIITRPKAS